MGSNNTCSDITLSVKVITEVTDVTSAPLGLGQTQGVTPVQDASFYFSFDY